MRGIGFVLLFCAPAMAAVTGTVVNRTTNQPQAGATVALYKLGQQNGLELIDQAKSTAQGQFTINQTVQGPHLIRTAFDGVTYNHMLPPGAPATGITLDVYNASKQPGSARVSKHMILLEPAGGQMAVRETYVYVNDGKTAWNDPDNGTLHFYLPPAANGKVQVNGTAPGGMPIGAPASKSSQPEVYQVDFPIKPGETRIDLAYSLPYTEGSVFKGKVVTKDENTYLIVPNGVTAKGESLSDMGQEPRTQAHIYGLQGTAYSVALTGAPAPLQSATGADSADQENGPKIEQIMPRVYDKAKLILALALGILALGFVLLYRAPGTQAAPAEAAKEKNDRRRR